MSNTKLEGLQVRREVMGDAFVDRALNNATEFSQPLQEFVNEHAWGGVWNREGLDRLQRRGRDRRVVLQLVGLTDVRSEPVLPRSVHNIAHCPSVPHRDVDVTVSPLHNVLDLKPRRTPPRRTPSRHDDHGHGH